jgi:segregation and condensation protein A
LARVRPEQLRDAAIRGLSPAPRPQAPDLDEIVPVRITIKEAVDDVLAGLPRHGATTFAELTRGVLDRMVVVVRFLAVLELYKQGVVDINQAERFGDITVERLAEGRLPDAFTSDDPDGADVLSPQAGAVIGRDDDLDDLDDHDDGDDEDDDLPPVVEVDLDVFELREVPAP